MNAPLDQPYLRAAAGAQAVHRSMSDAAHWMHASWLAERLQLDEMQLGQWSDALAQASRHACERASLALCASLGAAAPSLEQLAHPLLISRPDGVLLNAALLDACPAALACRILRMRALVFRRAEVRKLIDKRTRAMLSEWVGVGADTLCLDAHLADAPHVASLHAQIRMPLLATLDADALACEGFFLILRDMQASADVPPFALLRYALPRDLRAPAWLAKLARDVDTMGSARLFARLSTLLPEWAWLFG